ncbi:short-chain dehydrogenase/reductase SDR [Hyaloraphidium curvatum]|nr:short-chain dehydrogenase/reductase SDR [Hyaloraphidium curvatum]
MASQVTRRLVNASTGKGRVCFINGGASGIGASTALQFARNGASAIVLTDLAKQKDLGHSVIEELKKEVGSSLKTLFLPQDVTKEAEWIKVMEETHKAVGPLDVLVNSAGIGRHDFVLEDLELSRWQEMLDINLTGTFLGVKYGIRSMKENKAKESKSIINLSSIEGIVAEPFTHSYSASKGGVRLLTKSAALYCAQAKYGIRVNSIHPGYIATAMVSGALKAAFPNPAEAKAVEDALIARHPIGRLGVAREIADGAVFLASEESSFMTGSELVIDGGYTAQ